MQIEIIDKQLHIKGRLYKIKVEDKIIEILFLFHVIERIK